MEFANAAYEQQQAVQMDPNRHGNDIPEPSHVTENGHMTQNGSHVTQTNGVSLTNNQNVASGQLCETAFL